MWIRSGDYKANQMNSQRKNNGILNGNSKRTNIVNYEKQNIKTHNDITKPQISDQQHQLQEEQQ